MRPTTVTRHLDADPQRVMHSITDIRGLPAWNPVITGIVTVPDTLTVGSEWVVEVTALGQSWHSRSRVEKVDPATGRFDYRSCTDDQNPSYARWSWRVTPARDGGCEVSVSWELHPRTFWRRVLLARIRQHQLGSEVRASLEALERVASRSGARG